MSCAVVNDTCYIIGGLKKNGSPNRQVCSTSIPSLIQADLPESSSEASPSSHTWERHNCPLFFSTAAELEGHLLAIGGKDKNNTPSSAIHRYLPSSKSWEIIANGALPKPKYHAAAVRLEGGDIIIVGERINLVIWTNLYTLASNPINFICTIHIQDTYNASVPFPLCMYYDDKLINIYIILYVKKFLTYSLPMTHAVLIIQFLKLYTMFACQVINHRMLISLLFYATYL